MIREITFTAGGRRYSADITRPVDISLPLRNGKNNPGCYRADPVLFETVIMGDFIGDVNRGGSCNHKKVTVTPHGNGTHTECYGHISGEAGATLNRCLQDFLFVARLVSVHPVKLPAGDLVITPEQLENAFKDKPEALIIRTLPNPEEKKVRDYSGTNPPYFLPETMEMLVAHDIKHLLVDLPSLDREEDGGKLRAHHVFWRHPEATRRNCTVTELVYVEEGIADGLYLLDIHITSLVLDVSPSKPVLYNIYYK